MRGRQRPACGASTLLASGSLGLVLAIVVSAPGPAAGATAADSIAYAIRVTNINRLGVTTTNYGFLGNNLTSRQPSLEFPIGTGYEHMSRAGLWVGAIALSDTGEFTGVSTGVVDNAQGTNQAGDTEFTPAGNAILERSRIANSRFFSRLAISDQDFVSSYSDQPGRGPGGAQLERHTPLKILVKQMVLGFSLEAADAFEVVQFKVVNQGPPLQNLYLGLYAQFVSGDKDAYTIWPPSSAGGPGSWYYKTHIEYDAGRRLYKERYCTMNPYPTACETTYVPVWAGAKLLSVEPGSVAEKTVSFHWWSYAPGDAARDEDVERYALMSDGRMDDPNGCIPGGSCSPIMVLSVGPFAQVDPGDSIRVDFALVGGEDETKLIENAEFAQFASDLDYVLPAPPPSPRFRVESGEQRVDFYWDDSPEAVEDPTSLLPGGLDFEGYRLYLGTDRQRLTRIAQFDQRDTSGFNTGFDAVRLDVPRVVDGVTYRYRYTARNLRDGFHYYAAVTSYDQGDANVAPLESGIQQNKSLVVPLAAPGEVGGGVTVFPNPYRVEAAWDQGTRVRDHYLWFANLPARCMLRIYTLAGDLIFETRFDGGNYRGEGVRGLYDPRQDIDTPPPVLSGASYAWDLLSKSGQAIASGLYIYSVEDLDGGRVSRGKFLVVKSDRE